MTEAELWIKNEKEHIELKKAVEDNTAAVEQLRKVADITPMLIRWVIFPLVSILATVFGAERVITSFIK